MKKVAFLILVLIISNSIFSQNFENVDAQTFKKLIEKGDGVILDVRTSGEVASGHIAGCTAISVADQNFKTKINFIQKEKPVYVYCLSGSRSLSVANYMSQNGFKKVYNLQRGIIDWKNNSFPLEKSSNAVASSSEKYNTDGFNKIIKSNKIVLIDFYATWCAPCKKMTPDIDKLTEKYKGKAEIVKIDIEVNDEVSKSLKVESVPTLLLFKKGKEVWRNNGALKFDDIEKIIKKHL